MKALNSILFVCLGNICRSPTAEGVFKSFANKNNLTDLKIDSAGTSSYHEGEMPDPRAIRFAEMRGYDLNSLRARQVNGQDFEQFDLILAMDDSNYQNLIHLAQSSGHGEMIDKIKLLLDYSSQSKFREVPDPYYGGENGFNQVIDLIEDACQGIIDSHFA
ncbi:MAG: low molecular weight phosphotyrosine protein phosphatase [Gammaproteobacteria bacterium]|nr:low molecular weight phosphotyrosine protein phosphatase [Gammaproteobacteria bacterium]MDH5629312.1 low molecular weight phosphotyrosine protein phosphatase [Gammaproteobacteria bacterium]